MSEKLLHQLAGLYNIETSYQDDAGYQQQTSPHSLMAVLKALGAPLTSQTDIPDVLRKTILDQWRSYCEPVAIAWDDHPAYLELRLPAKQSNTIIDCLLELENGVNRRWTVNLAHLPTLRMVEVESKKYITKQCPIPSDLPWGYHQLTINISGNSFQTLIIAAPLQAYLPPAEKTTPTWGVFLPLYALRSKRSWAAGDITDLESLLHWVQELGGSTVGILPLLATYFDKPFAPSPYTPASRLFWNEFYLDITRAPELKWCPEALALINSKDFQKEISFLRNKPLVDYHRGFAIKRRILELLAARCTTVNSRQVDLQRWVKTHPHAQDYARFRAAMEQQGNGWTRWPDRMRNGTLQEGDYHHDAEQYHLYVQWLAHEQLKALAHQNHKHGSGLYMDFPLGVHRESYDAWRERDIFILDAGCGAPPDQVSTKGQNWGFPPLHPERIREQGYRHYIACLQHNLQHASILRLDHVMSLHRLFWIPAGFNTNNGVYVNYHNQEFYAILNLESHRHQTLLIGEDLGIVPNSVRASMARHKIYRMFILPYEIKQIPRKGINPVPARALASLNNHDMPPFKTWWQQKNSHDRKSLSMFFYRKGWLKTPTNNTRAILKTHLRYLAASRARLIMINLEDLWQETAPQNIPGTITEYPNWQRKARKDFETFSRMPRVLRTLKRINKLRKRHKGLGFRRKTN